jgi:hypothetical protein
MMERIINEFRVIETDDGFRIEIKGDKEKIKSVLSGFGGHAHGRHGRKRRRAFAWGPFGFGFDPWMWMRAAGCCGAWDAEAEAGEDAPEGAQA